VRAAPVVAVQKSRQDLRESKPKIVESIAVRKADLPVFRVVHIDHYSMALPVHMIMHEFRDRTYFVADRIYLKNLE
jgi:hypothetical protein